MNVRAISLFSGCGGADLGMIGGFSYLGTCYAKTGIEIVHASDINEKAVATYNANFENKAIVSDVHDLSFDRGEAEIVIGGFPCQAFSTVNPTKEPHIKSNQLFWEMARVISSVEPLVFIAENVRGFYTLSRGKYFELARKEFEDAGYNVFSEILDASDFGVPQKRQRLFMVGIREDMQKESFIFPGPTHGDGGSAGKAKHVLSDVIDSLEPSDPKYYFSQRAVLGVKRAKNNMKRALAQNLDDQCLTITSHLAKVSLNSRDPVLLVDPDRDLYRRFTPREAARIQSFPDSFKFVGSEADAYRQIGNAIPPVLFWNVIHAILIQVFNNDIQEETAC